MAATSRALSSPTIGDHVAGKYRLDAVLGSGAMGIVYAATHVDLGEPVAVKTMLPQLAAIDDLVARFLHEARAAARLKSPHVARVFDVGRIDGGVPYLAMEMLDGLTLSECLAGDERRFSFQEAALVVAQACRGLDEAHAAGIVHRDLKPGNLFLARERDGRVTVKLLDFGIAKTLGDLEGTQTGMLLGSPRYMAPEQMRSSKDVDARADIWSLGVILYQLVTGDTPYDADAFGELVLDVHSRPPRPPEELRPDLPEMLRSIIAWCLERERDARCGSARELADALVAFAGPTTTLEAAPLLEPEMEIAIEPGPRDTLVIDSLRAGAEAWPSIVVSPSAFRFAMLRAVANGVDAQSIHVADLYLAVGCLEGDPRAIEVFDGIVRDVVLPTLRRSRARANTGLVAVEMRQQLFGAGGAVPRLVEYSGRFPFAEWVRAFALRHARGHDSRPPPPVDHESDMIRLLDEAMLTLSTEERTALRLHTRDGVALERLATMLGLAPAELGSRLDAARDWVLALATDRLQVRGLLSRDRVRALRAALRMPD